MFIKYIFKSDKDQYLIKLIVREKIEVKILGESFCILQLNVIVIYVNY